MTNNNSRINRSVFKAAVYIVIFLLEGIHLLSDRLGAQTLQWEHEHHSPHATGAHEGMRTTAVKVVAELIRDPAGSFRTQFWL